MRHRLVSPPLRQHSTSTDAPFPVALVSVRVAASPVGAVARIVYYFREGTLPHHLRTLVFCIRLFRFREVNQEVEPLKIHGRAIICRYAA